MAAAPGAIAAGGGAGNAGQAATGEEEQPQQDGGMKRMMMQMLMFWVVLNMFSRGQQKPSAGSGAEEVTGPDGAKRPDRRAGGQQLRNAYGLVEDCDLVVHFSMRDQAPTSEMMANATLAAEEGYTLLWKTRVAYEADAPTQDINVTVGPLTSEVLSGDAVPYIHAMMRRINPPAPDSDEQDGEDKERKPERAIAQSLPAVAKLKELDTNAGAANLFAGDEVAAPVKAKSSLKVPYLKKKLQIRPVYDHTVHSLASLSQGPFKRLRFNVDEGIYEPFLYISDFWLLEKDFTPLNSTLEGSTFNLTLSYDVVSLWKWSLQAQMAEKWMEQGTVSDEWGGLTDTQRDSFMLKRLFLDTNPYFLAFSGVFLLLHTVFSMLGFKNEIQFWRNNKSMQGLSARSIMISTACQVITALYLLDSQETSRLILFEIFLDLSIAVWKLKKAVKVEMKPTFPFVHFGGQEGYEEAGTDKYDKEALVYVAAILTPVFIGYAVKSALYGQHRGWYSYLVGTAAGGVYTFGFAMMTPQLYINYKLQSVEHLPWRALTYKAMNTFVDDIAACLIDMPMMHRLSCFRDDIVFFIYIYQRWKYTVDKTRPTSWVDDPTADEPAAVANGSTEAIGNCSQGRGDGEGACASAAARAPERTKGAAEPDAQPAPTAGTDGGDQGQRTAR